MAVDKLRVSDVIKKDVGISVEEARKRMLEAGQAPSGIAGEFRKNAAVGAVIPAAVPVVTVPEPAPVLVPEPVVPTVAAVEIAPAVPVPVPAPQAERIETSQFVAEIRQEDGQWVAEIIYKTGGGTEKFEALTRKALDLKLLEGKANGTLRVRKAVRREKYGADLDKSYTLPEGVTNETFAAMPEAARAAVIDSLAMQDALSFRELHPEFYGTEENSDKLQKFLFKQNYPITTRNLEYAFEELMESDELEIRPTPKVVVAPSVPSPAPRVEDSAPAAVSVAPVAPATPTPPAPAVLVRKRGTTGLQPGYSSAADAELDAPEEGSKPRELSEAELRALPPAELKKQYQATMAARKKARQF